MSRTSSIWEICRPMQKQHPMPPLHKRLRTSKIELLAPAKDYQCGVEAIRHGADAVYVGAPKFGARAAVGNTLQDIENLCAFAHIYGARIYVALNTLLKDDELSEALAMVWDLYRVGVDALIVQDMALRQMPLPPIPLHASTQMDNRTAEKVRFLEDVGFSQVVLARELSLEEIRTIGEQTSVPLEVFVHGALCVGVSGQCYLSEAVSNRSANRGTCAQYCRLPYTLEDAEGTVIRRDKHLLSLRDMNRSEHIEELMDAGTRSFKIEGRLKDVSYVKNITAYYRQKIDEVLRRRPEYARASVGRSTCTFTPATEKSFNRGFTPFFLKGRNAEITAFDTPKSIGEPVGTVKSIQRNSFTVAGIKPLQNGDGLAFFNDRGALEGFRANRVEENNRVFPMEMPTLKPKTKLYRNFDQAFETLMAKPTAERKIDVSIAFWDTPSGFALSMEAADGTRIMLHEAFEKSLARKDQTDNIHTQLKKLGNTPYEAKDCTLELTASWFVPSSLLAEMRRKAAEMLTRCRMIHHRRELVRQKSSSIPYIEKRLTYLGNVSNSQAEAFYRQHGVEQIRPAYELLHEKGVPLMFSKHCLRFSIGECPTRQRNKAKPIHKTPFFLVHKDLRLRLEFDCKNCMMQVYKQE